jgi:predicted kinase
LVFLIVITGPIASGKSTLALAVARKLEHIGMRAAVVDLDLMYEMLDPGRSEKTDERKWESARRVSAWLADALLAEGLAVIVEGDFLTGDAREQFCGALASPAQPQFVMLRVSPDLALTRVQADPTRGLSRDPAFLRQHYEATAAAVSEVSSTDIAIDTGVVPIAEAARTVAEWAMGPGGSDAKPL